MDKQRILKEAQKIAAKYSFWMVSGNISHLYGYVYETPEKKFELEIKFDDDFPNSPPQLIFHNTIKDLLGAVRLDRLLIWTPDSHVVSLVDELKEKIQKSIEVPKILEEETSKPINSAFETKPLEEKLNQSSQEEYLTPDFDAFPPDFPIDDLQKQTKSNNSIYVSEQKDFNSKKIFSDEPYEITPSEGNQNLQVENTDISEEISLTANTELGLIQQYYAYDQTSNDPADISVYIPITLSTSFVISVNFKEYPERPLISFPEEIKKILGDPNNSLGLLKKWNPKKASHIVDVLQELESKFLYLNDIELESNKIIGEYKTEVIANSIAQLKINLLTYGFKEYSLELDLKSYPKLPTIILAPELEKIVNVPVKNLNACKNWKEKASEPIEIVREISWLLDKRSRINFEIDLLKETYKDIKYDSLTETLLLNMKGKMKTEDLVFNFQIKIPPEYPMKVPEIKILNEFEIEMHQKIKSDLEISFKNFFREWAPSSYLIDLFSTVSKKVFEISVLSCVICHAIQCPSCSLKIGGSEESCFAECPHCRKAYHKHCFEQTLSAFGKCGFCLKPLL